MHDHLAIIRAPTLCRENLKTLSAGYLSTRGDRKLYLIVKVFQIKLLAENSCVQNQLLGEETQSIFRSEGPPVNSTARQGRENRQ
jgi:hypothetical protein